MRWCAAFLVLLLLGLAPIARAEDEGAAADGDRLMNEGRAAYGRRDYKAAGGLFLEAQAVFENSGMESEAAESLLGELKAHVLQDKYVYGHKYEVGDIAIWDTQMTMHCATPIGLPDGTGTERLLWRISVRGTPAVFQ